MIINSQRTASGVIDNVWNNVQKNISMIQRANINKSKHSANKTIEVFGELGHQIFKNFDNSSHLKSPSNNNSLRLDSYMSVFNVNYKNSDSTRNKQNPILSNRIKRHVSTQTQIQSIGKKKKDSNYYDNIQSLDLPTPQVQYQDPHQQAIEDLLRNDLQISIQKKLQQKKKTKKKLLSAQQLREVFTYDYQYNRVKVAKGTKPKLINPLKSLLGKISKNVQKTQSMLKIVHPQNTRLKTTKILQHQRKKQPKSKKSKNDQQGEQEQYTKVEFSKVGTLTERIDCEPGVIFSSQGQIFKGKNKLKIQDSNQSNLRLSKLDYMMLKHRSKTTMNQINQKSKRTQNNKKSSQSQQKQKSMDISFRQLTKNTIYNTKISVRSKQQKISIQNITMHQFLLSPDRLPLLSGQTTLKTQQNMNQQQNSTINLDDNDKFNIKYIRGLIKPNKIEKISQQNTTIPVQELKESRKAFIKARQKVFSKKSAIKQIKRKFEQTLKQRQQRLIK